MASKITPQNLIDLQFVPEQFATVVDFSAWLEGLIATQEAIIAARLGTTIFDSVDAATLSQVTRISLCFCAAELLQMRINRMAGNIDADSAIIIRVLQSARKEYLSEFADTFGRLATGAIEDGADFASGYSESSHFDEAAA
jgi:hypothetical protein